MSTPSVDELSKIEIGAQVVQKPDGKHWITLVIATMLNQYTILLHPSLAQAIVDQLPDTLRQAIDQAKRADTGIVIAAPDALKNGKLNV